MDQKKINYLIGGVVGLLVVILGVYYYKNSKKTTLPSGNTENTVQNNNTLPENPIDESGTVLPLEEPKDTVPSSTTAEIKEKFNTAMTNARTAFRNKDYPQSIVYYNQALSYQKEDTVYSGLFTTYSAQGEWAKALNALDSAMNLNSRFTDYYIWKIGVLNEQTSASFQDLKKVYTEGLPKVDPATKINLVTSFATVAENNGQKAEAITVWEYAKKLYSENSSMYQAEIDRLQQI